MKAKPDLAGAVDVKLSVRPNGVVERADAKGLSPAFASCVAKAVKGVALPKPTDGGTAKVDFTLTFRVPDPDWKAP